MRGGVIIQEIADSMTTKTFRNEHTLKNKKASKKEIIEHKLILASLDRIYIPYDVRNKV